MTDLTRYLELAGRLERDTSIEASEAIRSLVERVRVAEPLLAQAYWRLSGITPDHNTQTEEAIQEQNEEFDRSLRQWLWIDGVPPNHVSRAALAQGKPGEADEFSTPSGHAES